MAYEGASLDANLAAAAGHDPDLVRELRAAFIESAERQVDLLGRSRCDGNWHVAAMRLKGSSGSAQWTSSMTRTPLFSGRKRWR